jgi:broad specificity phosphatase PhoE
MRQQMQFILARHGNTFDPEQKVLWVGARTDLPLVEKGRHQAKQIGVALASAYIVPTRFLAGPLLRTRQTAHLAASAGGYDAGLIEIDSRLIEIDYGKWEGLSSEEIALKYGRSELDAWNQAGVWPATAGWRPTESELRDNMTMLFIQLSERFGRNARLVLFSSNAVFRTIGRMSGLPARACKMRTGNMSLVEFDTGKTAVRFWDSEAVEFRRDLAALSMEASSQ